MFVDLQLWVNGDWCNVARLEPLGSEDKGYLGKVALEYESEYESLPERMSEMKVNTDLRSFLRPRQEDLAAEIRRGLQ